MNIDKLKTEAKQHFEKISDFLSTHSAVFAPVLEGVVRFEPRITCDGTTLDINVTGDKHVLEAIWGLLRRNGFKPSADERPKANEPTYSNFFYHDSSAVIWLMFSSTVCRRVKIGTKMVEQDVFETVCGEQEIPQPSMAEA